MSAARDSRGRFIKGSGGSANVTVKDNGLAKFVEMLKSLSGLRAKIGIQGAEADSTGSRGGGPTNVELATIHEYGAPAAGIPARPFLRPLADEKRDYWQKRLRDETAKAVKDKVDPARAVQTVGEEYRTAVIERVKGHVDPPLKPATIARKGEDVPLIDTGSMVGAITVKVER